MSQRRVEILAILIRAEREHRPIGSAARRFDGSYTSGCSCGEQVYKGEGDLDKARRTGLTGVIGDSYFDHARASTLAHRNELIAEQIQKLYDKDHEEES